MFDQLTELAKQHTTTTATPAAPESTAAAAPKPLSKQQEQRLFAPAKPPEPVDFGADLRSARAQAAAMTELTDRAHALGHGLRSAQTGADQVNDVTTLLLKVDAWNADAKRLTAMGDFMHDPVKAPLQDVARAAKLLMWQLQQTKQLVAELGALVGEYLAEVTATAHAFADLVARLSPRPTTA